MAEALLLFNPRSGSGKGAELAPRLLDILRERHPGIESEATQAAGSAGGQVRAAADRGVRTVYVCGGDGTLFEALQGAVGNDVTLAVLPLGTGNVVARDLGLPLDPVIAALKLMWFEERVLPVGVASRDGSEVYFLTAAGAGLHAELMHLPKTGAGGSRSHYFAEGARLAWSGTERSFRIRLHLADGSRRDETVSELIVVRVQSFGGALAMWKPGAHLLSGSLRVIYTRRHSRARLIWWLLKSVAGVRTHSDRHVMSMDVASVECVDGEGVPVEVDGEAFGNVPVRFRVREGAVRMLMPRGYPG